MLPHSPFYSICDQVEFERMDTELRQVNTNNEAIKQNYLELTELKEVLTKTQTYFEAVSPICLYTCLFILVLQSTFLMRFYSFICNLLILTFFVVVIYSLNSLKAVLVISGSTRSVRIYFIINDMLFYQMYPMVDLIQNTAFLWAFRWPILKNIKHIFQSLIQISKYGQTSPPLTYFVSFLVMQ